MIERDGQMIILERVDDYDYGLTITIFKLNRYTSTYFKSLNRATKLVFLNIFKNM